VTKDLLYEVAYDEAVRALSEQQAAIDSFRNRAGLLLSAGAVTTSFLGAQALDGGRSNPFSWLALISFVAVAATSLAILWPRNWDVTVNPRDVIKGYIESVEPVSIEELHRELALHMRGSYLETARACGDLLSSFKLLASYWLSRCPSGSSLSRWLPKEAAHESSRKIHPRARAKRPSPMYGERGMTLREAIQILTPRWLKRSSRGRSA
jgi:hypothetical protein